MVDIRLRVEDVNMEKRLRLIIGARLVILLLFSAVSATVSFFLARNLIDWFLVAVVAIGLLSGAYALLAKYNSRHDRQAYLQLLVDTVIITWLVYRTGDVASPLTPLYLVIILASSTILSSQRVYAIASASALLYGGLASATVNGLVHHDGYSFYAEPLSGAEIVYKVVLNIVAFYVVAALSERLATRLRGSANQLAKTTQRFSELRAFNERVIDSISSGLLTTDLEGRVKTFNRSAENITGFKFANVYDQPVSRVFGDISQQIGASLDGRTRKAGVLRFTTDCKTADNRKIVLGFSASPLIDEDGVHTGVVISFQDLTEVSKLEREMRRRDRLVSLGKMAAAIAHEVRNPLASMRGAIQVLHGELAPESEQAELMQIVLRESDRLNRIVTDFLSYARPQMPAKQMFDLCPLITETVRLMRHGSEMSENHTIVEDYPPDPVNIEGDPNQIKQVCWNLARNALQAMPQGGTLTIRVVNGPDIVTIEVEDSGLGMKDEQVERMFEPFSSEKSGGTGLGMAIVHQIVTDHNGRIDVNSTVGKGTKILIMLPAFTESNPCDEQNIDWTIPEETVADRSLTV